MESTENSTETAQAERPDREEPETTADMPAQSFMKSAGGITVSAEAPEGAFPQGTIMDITPVNGNGYKEMIAGTVRGEVLEVQAVDIKFYTPELREIEPTVMIRVTITPGESLYTEEKTSVVHIDGTGAVTPVEKAENTMPDSKEVIFDAEHFSIYAVVYSTSDGDDPDENMDPLLSEESEPHADPLTEESVPQADPLPETEAEQTEEKEAERTSAGRTVAKASGVNAKPAGTAEQGRSLKIQKIWYRDSSHDSSRVRVDLRRTTEKLYTVTVNLLLGTGGSLYYTLSGIAAEGASVKISWRDNDRDWAYNDGMPRTITVNNASEETQLAGHDSNYYVSASGKTCSLTIGTVMKDLTISLYAGTNLTGIPSYSILDGPDDDKNPLQSLTLSSSNGWAAANWTVMGIYDDPDSHILKERDSEGRDYHYYIHETGIDNYSGKYAASYERSENAEEIVLKVTNTGTEAPPAAAAVHLLKVDRTRSSSDSSRYLEGAVFKLRQLDETLQGVHYRSQEAVISDATDGNGTTSFADLPDGFYEISESRSPDGYVLATEATFYLEVKNAAVRMIAPDDAELPPSWQSAGDTEWVAFSSNSPNDATVTLGNMPGTVLPMTGGEGKEAFTVIGGLLTATAAALIIDQNRKKKTVTDAGSAQ